MVKNLRDALDPNQRYINGPVNVARLEGTIDGIDKVLYLFMDFHIPVKNQQQCENIFSEDVSKFFANTFAELSLTNTTNDSTRMYDFFVEVRPKDIYEYTHKKDSRIYTSREMYIWEVIKLFTNTFKHNPTKNIVKINDAFKNVRLHYLDIRDTYKNVFMKRLRKINDITIQMYQRVQLNTKMLTKLEKIYLQINKHIKRTIMILSKKNNPPTKITLIRDWSKMSQEETETFLTESMNYLANKIKNNYNHLSVKKVMRELLIKSIISFKVLYDYIEETIEKIKEYIASNHKNDELIESADYIGYGNDSHFVLGAVADLLGRYHKTTDSFVSAYARMTDIFMLRRFLDKDYITNAIVYSGAAHSSTYVNVLVRYFGFQITHISTARFDSLKKLNSAIKRLEWDESKYLFPKKFKQCSNIKDFPDNFL